MKLRAPNKILLELFLFSHFNRAFKLYYIININHIINFIEVMKTLLQSK